MPSPAWPFPSLCPCETWLALTLGPWPSASLGDCEDPALKSNLYLHSAWSDPLELGEVPHGGE